METRVSVSPVPLEIGRANRSDVKISWNDGHESVYPARELRLHCPCASCVSETTGERTLDPAKVNQNVRPRGIQVVGRYAIQITWSDGHSTGIYTFDRLRAFCPCPKCGPTTTIPDEVSASCSTPRERRLEEAGLRVPGALTTQGTGVQTEVSVTTKTTTREITKDSTMEQVLEAYPGAQRALFRRYHIGGCSSCGFQPTDRLEDVLMNHNVLEVAQVIDHIKQADELDRRDQVEPKQVAESIKRGDVKLLDVRPEEECALAQIKGAQLLTEQLASEVKSRWPKDSQIVLYCHHGTRSLDVAAYFIGHGFTNVRSMKGGIDAWSLEVDSSVPRYN